MQFLNSSVCIIGAGPSGAATSIFLSKMGIEHIIVDAAEFPRDKVCGDGLDIKAVRMLNHIAPEFLHTGVLSDNRFTACWGLRLTTPKGKVRTFKYEPLPDTQHQPLAFTCKRMHFDEFLVKRIDSRTAVFLPGTKITNLERAGDQWHISGQGKTGDVHITCDLVIGADGDHSIVARHLQQRKVNRKFYSASVRQYWKNVSGMHDKNLMEMYFPAGKARGAYFWIFPLPNGEANVGYIALSEHVAKYKINVADTFRRMIEKDEVLKERFALAEPVAPLAGWGLPLAALHRTASGDGYLLVGDAASLISPITGEGVGSGMMSGYIAAHFVKHAIQRNNFKAETFRYYNREIHKYMKDEVSLYNNMQKHGWLFNSFININLENGLVNSVLQRSLRKWLHTAYNAEMKVAVE